MAQGIGPVLPETSLALDTNVFTAWRYNKPRINQEIYNYISLHKRPPAMTSITIFEALHGIERKITKPGSLENLLEKDRDETERLIEYCALLPSGISATGVLPFDHDSAKIASYISSRLSKNMSRNLLMDVFIAAIAIAHGHGVATGNENDFKLIATHLPPSHPLIRLAIWKP